jgi:hypothetical protein|tara:strand:+ start:8366 stop:10735 length:2370 start_codon:yes stop_codon:yes gene_type:complete
MIDFDILKDHGTTNERLREVLSAKLPAKKVLDKMEKSEVKALQKDIDKREEMEKLVASRITEAITFSLRNHHLYSSVDLAWDSTPLNSRVIPLVMYAQKRINVSSCVKELDKLKVSDKYVKRGSAGQPDEIDLPKFFEVNINLVRSFVTRRLAAQVNKYNNLYPFFKYEPRTTGVTGKVRADVLSQRVEIMSDQYDYRHFQTQVVRDMFLYGHSVAFPRAAWEREVQWEKANPEYDDNRAKTKVTKEGISWINPHPSRVFWDNAYPLTSLNSDTGSEYVGFWDVVRYRDVMSNPMYFNRDSVGYTTASVGLFTQYSTYFNHYYTQIVPPRTEDDLTSWNDRKNSMGMYSGEMGDTSVFVTDYFMKLVPNQWGIGDYPHPVWVHMRVAGDSTIIFAEFLPSSPAAVFSYNENDTRLRNLSVAHELMSYQDQLTNLFSQLLETTKADLFNVGVLNTDIFPDTEEGLKLRQEFQKTMSGENYYATTHVLEASFQKLANLGIDTNPDNVFKIIRSQPNSQLTNIFRSIAELISISERLMALSPQEQGQPSPRETSATEVLTISNTTESVYTFISEAVDEGRAAMKRVIYESIVAMGSNTIHLPVKNRYIPAVIQKAGFDIDTDDAEMMDPDLERRYTIIGSKRALCHDYIFTSRDGSERASNLQQAQALIQVFQIVSQSPVVLEALGKDKYFELVNEIARKSGTDLKLEIGTGQDNSLTGPNQQMQQVMEQMAGIVEQNAIDINSIKEALGGGGQEADPQSGTMLERQAAQEQAAAQALAAEIQPQQQQEPIV